MHFNNTGIQTRKNISFNNNITNDNPKSTPGKNIMNELQIIKK